MSCVKAVLAFGLVGLPSLAWAGAWTLPEGASQVLVTAAASSASNAFDGSGGLSPIPRYNKIEVLGLYEYGMTDAFTLIAAASGQHIDIAPPFDAARTGAGYSEFGGRYQLLQNNAWVLSTQATIRMPGTQDTSNLAAIGYTGVEGDLRVLLGRSFMLGTTPAFMDLQLAERLRAVGPNEFRADLTFGFQLHPRFQLLVQSFNVVSEGAALPLFPSYNYHKLQLSGVIGITPAMSLQVGGFTTYAGRNALQENGVITGIWYKF